MHVYYYCIIILIGDMKIAIIGLGSIGMRHAMNLKALEHNDLFGCDTNVERCIRATKELGIDCCTDVADVWAYRPDVVFICTPPESHVHLAYAAATTGAAIFVEKPLSSDFYGVNLLTGTLERLCLVNMVACNLRFHPGTQQIQKWLEENAIGEVLSATFYAGSYLPSWHPDEDYKKGYVARTGVILDVGSHEVDLATWLLGDAKLKAAVRRTATSIGLECDGLAEMILEHDSDVVSTIHVNFVQRQSERWIRIMGTEGQIFFNLEMSCAELFPNDGYWRELPEDCFEWNDMYKEEVAYFMKCVMQRRQTMNTVSQAARVLDILLHARQLS